MLPIPDMDYQRMLIIALKQESWILDFLQQECGSQQQWRTHITHEDKLKQSGSHIMFTISQWVKSTSTKNTCTILVSSHSIICLRQALSMEEQQPEEAFAPFAVCLSPILFSEEEDSEYDSLNPADRREDTIVLFRKDISPVYCMSSEESPLLPPNRMYTPDHETYPWKYKYQDTCIRDCSVTDYISDAECKSFSPSCAEAKEETELTHNSPTLLLEISSSSGTTSISEESNFRENDEEQSLDYDALTSRSSDSSSECKCNNCDPPTIK
ncbi:hypothetical protein GDO81_001774 [Engystomops pustulosus]|uniref:Uncharacterized protein n=1 Tax=Engystomops pustulosus TaxID=76066 RepID=A0AAV7DHM4_ENGPU|nr:hypothetical protein GDO81_001774 [Engystomops pustulosus]